MNLLKALALVIGAILLSYTVNAAGFNAVSDLSLSLSGDKSIELSWSYEALELVSSFNIYKAQTSITSSNKDSFLYSETSQASFKDFEVEKGKTYYYRITAVNEAGKETELSNEVSVKVPGFLILSTNPQTVSMQKGESTSIELNALNDSNDATAIELDTASPSNLSALLSKESFSLNENESTKISLQIVAGSDISNGSYELEVSALYNGLETFLEIPVKIGTEDLVSFSYDEMFFCAEDSYGFVDLEVRNESSSKQTFNLSASSLQFTPSLSDNKVTLEAGETAVVPVRLNFDPNGNYGSTITTTTETTSDSLEAPSCSDIVFDLHSIQVDQGTTQEYEFNIINNSDYDFEIESFDASDSETDLSTTELETPDNASRLGSETFSVEVSALDSAKEKIATGRVKVSGKFANGKSCTSSSIGTQEFDIFVGNVEDTPVCTEDFVILSKRIVLEEEDEEVETFTVVNNSSKKFTIASVSVSEDESSFDARVESFDSEIPAFGIGEVNVRIESFEVSKTETLNANLSIDGSFTGGIYCGGTNKDFDVRITNTEGTTTTTTTSFSGNFSITVSASNNTETFSDIVKFDVARCDLVQEGLFSFTAPTACQSAFKNKEKDISYTLRNLSSSPIVIDLNVEEAELPIDLLTKTWLKAGESSSEKLTVKPRIFDEPGKYKFKVNAFNYGIIQTREICIELKKTHMLEIVPERLHYQIQKGTSISIPIEVWNGDYDENVSLSYKGTTSLEAEFSEDDFELRERYSKTVLVNVSALENASVGTYSLEVKAKAGNVEDIVSLELEVVEGEVKEADNPLRIDSYPLQVRLSPREEKELSFIITNATESSQHNIKVLFANLPKGVSFDTQFIVSLSAMESREVSGTIKADEFAEKGFFDSKVVAEGSEYSSEKNIQVIVAEEDIFSGLTTGFFSLFSGGAIFLGLIVLVIAILIVYSVSYHKSRKQVYREPWLSDND